MDSLNKNLNTWANHSETDFFRTNSAQYCLLHQHGGGEVDDGGVGRDAAVQALLGARQEDVAVVRARDLEGASNRESLTTQS